MDRKFVGPMPVNEFLDRFTLSSPDIAPRTLDCPPTCIRTLEGVRKLFPNLHFHDPTTAASATEEDAITLPPISVLFSDEPSEKSSDTIPERATWDMFFELTPLDEDPFQDPSPEDDTPRSQLSFQRETSKALVHRRRLAYLFLDMFMCRARTFVFSVIILKDQARLIRADRSGAVVTELFPWTGEESPLVVFLRRFSAMSRAERGFDPTVTLPSPEEIRIARDAFKREDVDADYPDFRMQKFHVRDEVTDLERVYIAGVPRSCAPNVAGRGTNGYMAVDLDGGSLVWIKDSWRLNKSYVRKEADVYRKLMEAEIPRISPMVCGGDVDDQQTQSHNFVKAPWACDSHGLSHHTHHRVVLSTVGRPLKKFTSTHELTTAIRDAIEAHSAVFTKLNILHGDISAGNIVITKDGHGILIDWDLSIDLTKEKRSALTGTWQFISAALLEGEGAKPHQLQDDLESFVHVYVYHIVRYRPTGVRSVLGRLESVYRAYAPGKPSNYSTNGKFSFFGGISISNAELSGHICESAHSLVKELRRLFFRAIYADDTDIEPEMRPPAVEKLATSAHILELFDTALKGEDWAVDDGSQDVLGEDDRDDSGKATTGKRTASAALGQDKSRSPKRLCTTSSRSSRSKTSRSRSSS
ncbi:hypothetical protein OF83DRAFT_1115418 [Amylostereum chailletii]|nr:hypothetical protein OF83DRAFT_1115418 [Amylostereum chailletii]